MLVLSRRPQEKILFPGTGISIEIVQTKGNTVRVGIEAPKSVRVLRGEIAESGDLHFESPITVRSSESTTLPRDQSESLIRQLDEIYLAIALAQNQNRQDLPDHVGFALDEAMERLDVLRDSVKSAENLGMPGIVCEPSAAYGLQKKTGNQDATLVIEPDHDVAYRFEFELAFSDEMCCVE